MKIPKYVLTINAGALAMNGIIVWLMVAQTFPALLGILLFFGCIAGAVWFSCYLNGALPGQRRRRFYSAETERIESL